MSWNWKLATSTDDVVNLLNGAGASKWLMSQRTLQ